MNRTACHFYCELLFLGFCSAHERHWFNSNPIHLQEAKRGRNPSALKIYKTLAFGHNQAELSYLTHTHTRNTMHLRATI